MTFNAGDRVTLANFADLPVNTLLEYDRSTRVMVHENNMVLIPSYGEWYPVGQIVRSLRVQEVGYHEPTPESIEGFRQRLNTICVGYARMNSVSVNPVRERLNNLREPDTETTATTPLLGVGMWLHRSDSGLREQIERKRGVQYGLGNPNDETFKVWRADGRLIYGNAEGREERMPQLLRVVAMDDPDTDMWLDQTPADPDRLARYKGRIWTEAIAAKSAHSYCGQLEAAMYTAGISEENVAVTAAASAPAATPTTPLPGSSGFPVGHLFDNEGEQARLPVGAVLMYEGMEQDGYTGQWNWMRRSASPRYPSVASTQYLMGPNSGHHGSASTLIWDGYGDMLIPLTHEAQRAALPVGTEVSMGPGMLRFRKIADNEWRGVREVGDLATNTYHDTGFPLNNSWYIVALPEV